MKSVIFWQAKISLSFGKEIAKEIGDAHEKNTNISSEIEKNGTKDEEEADSYVDQKNNELARNAANNLSPDISNKDLAKATLEYYMNVGLWCIKKNGGKYYPVKVRMSKAENKDAKNNLRNLDENGYKEEGSETPLGTSKDPSNY